MLYAWIVCELLKYVVKLESFLVQMVKKGHVFLGAPSYGKISMLQIWVKKSLASFLVGLGTQLAPKMRFIGFKLW